MHGELSSAKKADLRLLGRLCGDGDGAGRLAGQLRGYVLQDGRVRRPPRLQPVQQQLQAAVRLLHTRQHQSFEFGLGLE